MKNKLLIFFLSASFFGNTQITVDNTDIDDVINDFFVGQGVYISNITFNGLPFDTTYSQVGYFFSGSSGFPFDMGIVMGTGNVILAEGPNNSNSATNNTGVALSPNDPDLMSITTASIYNQAVLEFDFIPAGDSVVFEYIFASEEYHEYAPSSFNDVFAFFISGPGISGPYTNMAENIAIIPGTSLPVSINNINNGTTNTGPCTNCSYLVTNAGGDAVQYDAYTTVLNASSAVVCGEVYHMKLAITDVGDWAFDSGIFLKGSSFISNGLGMSIGGDQAFTFFGTELTEGCDSLALFLQLPDWAIGTNPVVNITTGGNAIKDIDYIISDTIISFAPGDTIVPFFIQAIEDGIAETGDSILLTINFLTPCGDTLGVDKVIYLNDVVPGSVSVPDTTINCPGETVLLEPVIVGGGSFNLTTWSTGDTTSTINLTVLSDTIIIVQVYTGCLQPYLIDTIFINLLSDMGGAVTGPTLCYNDSLVSIYFNGSADSLSWGADSLIVPFTGIYFYDLQIYDTTYGCIDSLTYQVFLYPTPFIPYINNVAGTLITDTSAAYQWYFNGLSITGADSMTYIPSNIGYYKVEVWDTNGCSIFSDSIYVSSLLDLNETISGSDRFFVYPNPSKDLITLEFPERNENSRVIIHSITGQVLFQYSTSGLKNLQVDLDGFASGSYLISFINDDETVQTTRLIIY